MATGFAREQNSKNLALHIKNMSAFRATLYQIFNDNIHRNQLGRYLIDAVTQPGSH